MGHTVRRNSALDIYWQTVFWVVLAHLAVFTLIGVVGLFRGTDRSELANLKIFPVHELGIWRASALWLVKNSFLLCFVTIISDVVALRIFWTVVRSSANAKHVAAYVICVFGFGLIHFGVFAYVISVGVLQTHKMTYVFEQFELLDIVGIDLILTFPAILLLGSRIVLGWPHSVPGTCRRCGYDLRASKDRCPECGTIIPVATV